MGGEGVSLRPHRLPEMPPSSLRNNIPGTEGCCTASVSQGSQVNDNYKVMVKRSLAVLREDHQNSLTEGVGLRKSEQPRARVPDSLL